MNPLAWAALCAFVLAMFGGTYAAGYRSAQATYRVKVAELNAEARETALEMARRVDRLHVEVEVLRGKPERVRTVVKEVRVEADTDCRSLPVDWRVLWNALPRDPGAAEAAALDHEQVSGLADSAGDGEGRD